MLIRQRKALNRSGTATQEKGISRLISILNAAREVFIEAGYAALTMRKVAARAGISIGNLNYYYRTKEDLLRDLLEYVINDYLEEFARRRLMWALGNHDPHIAELVDDLYAKARQPLNELIPQINPTLTKKEAEQIALYMCAAMEGLTVFVGNGKSWSGQIKEIKQVTIRNFMELIKNTKGRRR